MIDGGGFENEFSYFIGPSGAQGYHACHDVYDYSSYHQNCIPTSITCLCLVDSAFQTLPNHFSLMLKLGKMGIKSQSPHMKEGRSNPRRLRIEKSPLLMRSFLAILLVSSQEEMLPREFPIEHANSRIKFRIEA